MHIAIMRAFIALRKIVLDNSVLHIEILNIKKKVENHDKSIDLVFQYLDELMEKKNLPNNQSQKRIGFKPD